jgi:GT2 family glycosyltransferase
LGGKRLKLGPQFSQEIREGKLSLPQLERGLLWLVRALFKDRVKFFEEGVYIEPAGLLNFIAVKRRIRNLKGCNFSCYKEALIAINGFDEDYVRPAVGEDIDLTWRFIGLGYNLFSVRNYAVQYHLHHRENWSSQEENLELMREKQSEELIRCLNGLEKEQTVLEQDVYAKRSLSV